MVKSEPNDWGTPSAYKDMKRKHSLSESGFKQKTIKEYFLWRERNSPDVIKYLRASAKGKGCQWCEKFAETTCKICLHCGEKL